MAAHGSMGGTPVNASWPDDSDASSSSPPSTTPADTPDEAAGLGVAMDGAPAVLVDTAPLPAAGVEVPVVEGAGVIEND